AALALQGLGVFRENTLDHQRGAHGALGVVFVRLRCAEDRHDLVADDLVDSAAVPLDDIGDALERAVDDALHLFGIAHLAELGETGEVAEHHCDDPALFARRFGLQRAARWAVARPVWDGIAAARARMRAAHTRSHASPSSRTTPSRRSFVRCASTL